MVLPDENGYTPKYQASWSRATPGLVIFLIDQSASMSQFGAGKEPIAERVANLVKSAIRKLLIMSCIREENVTFDTMFIECLFYGGYDSFCRYSYWLSEFQELYEFVIQPVADGLPDMTEAFAMTAELIRAWAERDKESDNRFHDPIPVIFHLTKGTNIGDDEELIENAQLIKDVEMRDGHPLLFNLLFPTHDFYETLEFPSEKQLSAIGLNEEYVNIIKSASPLPKEVIEEFRDYGYNNIDEDSLCILVNPTTIPVEHIRNRILI